MPPSRDAFCSSCGAPYPSLASYPRTCASCHESKWANPIPVCVALVPVTSGARTGLLVVRRAIEPGKGKLALVGGFLEEHETWQQGCAREAREETGAIIDPETLAPLWFTSSAPRPNRVLLFASSGAIDAASLAPFRPNDEVSERGIVHGPRGLASLVAFPLHAEAMERFFGERGIDGDADYRVH